MYSTINYCKLFTHNLLLYSEIIIPDYAPRDFLDLTTLLSAIENAEKRYDARTGRTVRLTLPNDREFSDKERIDLARSFVKDAFVSLGMCAIMALHVGENENPAWNNPHAHVLLTDRPVDSDGFCAKKSRNWNTVEQLHIHERHVFDYVNRYGEVEPKQEKALEALGFELPDPEKNQGRTNNRKMVFDAVCRVILFDICKRHGLAVEEEPDPGNRGRSYLMKNDYIIQKQKKLITEQETAIEEKAQALEAVSLRLEDAEALIDEVTEIAYDKAVELVTDAVRAETQLQDEKIVSDYKDWCLAPERRYSPAEKGLIGKVLGKAQELIHKAAQKVLARVQAVLRKPEVRAAATRQIKEKARESVLAKLQQGRAEIARQDAERRAAQSTTRHGVER